MKPSWGVDFGSILAGVTPGIPRGSKSGHAASSVLLKVARQAVSWRQASCQAAKLPDGHRILPGLSSMADAKYEDLAYNPHNPIADSASASNSVRIWTP